MEYTEITERLAAALVAAQAEELQSFGPIDDPSRTCEVVFTHRFPVGAVVFETPLRLICGAIGAAEKCGFDKTAWIYHFSANGQRCSLRYTRSGMKLDLLESLATGEDAPAIAQRTERQLMNAARRIYRRVIFPEAERKMKTGDVILLSQPRYRQMVDFYLDELRSTLPVSPSDATEPGSTPHPESIDAVLSDIARRQQIERARDCRSTALVAGYFSWVQHLLVRLTAFSREALNPKFSVTDLLNKPWAEQFDTAYPDADAATSQLKGDLKKLASDFRNPLLHGGDRLTDGIVIEWAPGNWSFVVDPLKPSAAYMILQPALDEDRVKDLLARIEQIDLAFKSHPFYDWVTSGLPAYYDTEHVENALHALATDTVAQYIEAEEYSFDTAVNWD